MIILCDNAFWWLCYAEKAFVGVGGIHINLYLLEFCFIKGRLD